MKTLNKKSVLIVLLTFVLLLSLAFVFVPSNNVKASNSETLYVKGAQAYSGDDADTSAIRFVAGVNKTWYNETLLPANQDKTITFGLLIAPNKGAELTTATANVKDFTYNSIKENTIDGDLEYMGDITYLLNDDFWADLANKKGVESLTDSEKDEYRLKAHSMDLVARPYYTIDGGEPVYGEQIEYARSIRNVVNQTVIDGEDISKEAVEKYLGTVKEVKDDGIFFDDKTKEIFGYEATEGMTYSVAGKSIPATVTESVATLAGLTAEVKPGVDFVISAFDSQNNVTRITAKHASVVLRKADDITWLFGATNAKKHLDGYYVLGNDIDASTADVDGGLRWYADTDPNKSGVQAARFWGTFDGRGFVISNLNLTGGSSSIGSLFGQMGKNAVIMNVAFDNVTASKAAIVGSHAYADITGSDPQISNVYASVSNLSSNFKGLMFQTNQQAIKMNNVIVEYLKSETGTEIGSFAAKNVAIVEGSSDLYVISKTNETSYDTGDFADVTSYGTISAMKADVKENEITFDSFDNSNWKIVEGIPVWHSLNAKDDASRALSTMDKSIDLSNLSFDMSEVSAIEIAGTKVDVTDGALPDMTIKATKTTINSVLTEKLTLTINSNSVETTKDPLNKDFDPISMTVYFADDDTDDTDAYSTLGSAYELVGVQAYSKLIMNDVQDLKDIFSSTAELSGYYVLGEDVTADTTGYRRTSYKFTGIFDGMGHVVKNIYVRHGNGSLVSLFGQLNNTGYGAATIRNVAFNNLMSSNSALVWDSADGNNTSELVPVISNVYVSLSTNSTKFVGLVYNPSHVTINNCIIADTRTTAQDATTTGSLVGKLPEKIKATSANNYVISKTPFCVGFEDSIITCAKRYDALKDFTDAVANALADEDETNDFDFSSFTTNNYCWTISTDGIPVWKALSGN